MGEETKFLALSENQRPPPHHTLGLVTSGNINSGFNGSKTPAGFSATKGVIPPVMNRSTEYIPSRRSAKIFVFNSVALPAIHSTSMPYLSLKALPSAVLASEAMAVPIITFPSFLAPSTALFHSASQNDP